MSIMESRWIKKDNQTIISDSNNALAVNISSTGPIEVIETGITIKSASITNSMLAGSIADDKLASSYLYADGTRALTGNLNMGTHKITNLSDATTSSDAVTYAQLQQVATQSKVWKEAVFSENQLSANGIAAAQVIRLSANLQAGDSIILNDGTTTQTLVAGTDFAIAGTVNGTLDNLSVAINAGTIAISSASSALSSIDSVNNVLVIYQDTVGQPTRVYGNAAAATRISIADPTLSNVYEASSTNLVALPTADPAATNFGFYRAVASLAANETHISRTDDSTYTWDSDGHTWQMSGSTSIPYGSKTVAGKVQIGDGIQVSSGIISLSVGNGLIIASDQINIDTTDTIYTDATGVRVKYGNGLSEDVNGLYVVADDGITVAATGVSVNTTAIAGTGLENDGSNNLRIASTAAGNGLSGGSGTALSVTADDGITVAATGVSVNTTAIAGTGLENDGSNNLRIASTAAGDGLQGGSGTALSVKPGNGISATVANGVALTTLTADWNAGTTFTIQVKDPVNASDVANKNWVETQIANTNSRTVELFTLNATDITNKYIDLAGSPALNSSVILNVKGAPSQFYGDDYSVTGNRVSWNSLGLDGVLVAGDKLTISYNV